MLTIQQVLSLGEPQRAYKWQAVLPTIANINPSNFLEEVDIPDNVISSGTYELACTTYNYPETLNATSFSLTFFLPQTAIS